MHIMVSWEIEAEGARRAAINAALRRRLHGYSWVRPLSSFYIVRVRDSEDRAKILDGLKAVARGVNASERVRVLVGPIVAEGHYSGMLPRDMWDKIHKRTDTVQSGAGTGTSGQDRRAG